MELFPKDKKNNNSSFFKVLDVFGVNINLSYRKQRSYRTIAGGIISIIFFVLFFITCGMFLEELISKDDFNLITNSMIDPNITIDFNVPILFRVGSSKGLVNYDERLFNFKVLLEQYLYYKENGKMIEKYVPSYLSYDKCDKVLNNSKYVEYFSDINLSTFYCINLDQNLSVKGIFGNSGYNSSDFRIYVNRCSNDTKAEHDCYPLETINDRVSIYIFVYFI